MEVKHRHATSLPCVSVACRSPQASRKADGEIFFCAVLKVGILAELQDSLSEKRTKGIGLPLNDS